MCRSIHLIAFYIGHNLNYAIAAIIEMLTAANTTPYFPELTMPGKKNVSLL
jgi:hypothetical protein